MPFYVLLILASASIREGGTYPRQKGKVHDGKRNSSRIQCPSSRVGARSPITRNTARDTPNSRSGHDYEPRREAFLPHASNCCGGNARVGEWVEEDVFAVGVDECVGGGD